MKTIFYLFFINCIVVTNVLGQITSQRDFDDFLNLYPAIKNMKRIETSNQQNMIYYISKKDPSISWSRGTSIFQGKMHTFDQFSITRKDVIYKLSCNTMSDHFEFSVSKKVGRQWLQYKPFKRSLSFLPKKMRVFVKYPVRL